jgi:hypothetical protein
MADAAERAENGERVEYSIYSFDFPAVSGRARWKKQDSRTEMADALAAARTIFRTGKYGKVEIRRKYYDPKLSRHVDATLKVFENRNDPAMFFFPFLFSLAVFIFTYVLRT